MTSLGLLQYSEISDNSTINSNMTDLEKKKQGRHNITIKKRQPVDGSGSGNSENVQNMLKLINNSNGYENMSDDSGLVDFNPPPRAEVSSKDTQSASAAGASASAQKDDVTVDFEKPITIANNGKMNEIQEVGPRRYPAPLDSYEGFNASPKTYATDFYKQYVPYFNQMDQGSNAMSKDQLLEKLNYMIYLLEEQKDEKTGHVMEEIILYSFLGVFIIFIVDSFARAGKYTR
jgi:hypothetical protein